MYVSGIKLGFTTEDMRTMPFNRLASMFAAINEAESPQEPAQDNVREATQADFANF